MLHAGKLDQRVTLEEPVEVRDPNFGTAVKSWTARGTVWAAVEPQSGREFLANSEPGSELAVRVRIRYSASIAGVSPKWRVNLGGGRVLQIVAVIQPAMGKSELQLVCNDYRQG